MCLVDVFCFGLWFAVACLLVWILWGLRWWSPRFCGFELMLLVCVLFGLLYSCIVLRLRCEGLFVGFYVAAL